MLIIVEKQKTVYGHKNSPPKGVALAIISVLLRHGEKAIHICAVSGSGADASITVDDLGNEREVLMENRK